MRAARARPEIVLLLGGWSVAIATGCRAASSSPADAAPGSSASAASVQSPPADTALGEQIYRKGTGRGPITATLRGAAQVSAASFPCVGCHLGSGLGGVEGQLAAPAINGAALFAPKRPIYRNVVIENAAPLRPAYTDETLARAIRTGVDPAGRALDPSMPRYEMADADFAALSGYLKTLSSQLSPGVEPGTMHLATVLTDDASQEERDAMRFVLERFVSLKNNQSETYGLDHENRAARMAANATQSHDVLERGFDLAIWELHGPPDTWRPQLDAFYAKRAPFVLLGGVSHATWQPIADFCDEKKLPAVFPVTDVPAQDADGHYTLYVSRGAAEEGAAAARFLASQPPATKPASIGEVTFPGPVPAAMQSAFDQTWDAEAQAAAERGGVPRTTVAAGENAALPQIVRDVLDGPRPRAVIVWGGAASVPLLKGLAAAAHPPDMILISAPAFGSLGDIPDALRPRVRAAWPYRMPEDDAKYAPIAMGWIRPSPAPPSPPVYRVASTAFAAIEIFSQTLSVTRDRYYADFFLEQASELPDQRFPLYERISFAPGQRYGSKGAYVVSLAAGRPVKLRAASDWITH